jgi:Ala-tRNA(Pro) deacylase
MESYILKSLQNLGIPHSLFEHAAVFTCDETRGIDIGEDVRVKSLLVINDKKTHIFMIVLPEYERLDTRRFALSRGDKKCSFVSPELMQQSIGVLPGSVSPFALLNNTERNIFLCIHDSLRDKKIGFHPLRNTGTIVVNMSDLEIFFHEQNIVFEYINFSSAL